MIKKESKKTIKKTLKNPKNTKPNGLTRKKNVRSDMFDNLMLPPRVVAQIAEEVAKVVAKRMPKRRAKTLKSNKKIESAVFLDTSAIIDMRVFDLGKIGALYGTFIVLESVLLELKNIADSKDGLKKDRGRRAMDALDKFKKVKGMKVKVMDDHSGKPVDESLIEHAKIYHGRIITCDYNLAKKAKISNVVAVDLYEMTNILKTQALPGEEFFVKIVQEGKGVEQGVGYLPDGTMLVVEQGKGFIGKTVGVTVSRIIQTDAGKILFSKIKAPEVN